MPSANITVTSKTGPGSTVTSLALANVREINFNVAKQVLTVVDDSGVSKDFDLYGTTTVTYTIASRVATVAASQ